MKNRVFIVYSSPAGSTRHVAKLIETVLDDAGAEVHTLDIAAGSGASDFIGLLGTPGSGDMLFLGSPVYRDVAVPPVMDFIRELPDGNGCFAVPFVTWGAACSGVALWQMGKALEPKGFTVAGGFKVMGRHSMMWKSEEPAGAGHPDGDDDLIVRGLVAKLYQKLGDGTLEPVDLSVFDYQSESNAVEMKAKVDQPWRNVPRTVEEDTCTQCGQCADECPADTITLDPYPVFGTGCFDCFNCIRLCPEEAITPAIPLEASAERIMKRVATFNETPPTCGFGIE